MVSAPARKPSTVTVVPVEAALWVPSGLTVMVCFRLASPVYGKDSAVVAVR